MTEPLPCPFCGGAPRLREGFGFFSVQCETPCPIYPRVKASSTESFERAIELWNTRAPVKCGPCAGCGFADMGMSNEQRCENCS